MEEQDVRKIDYFPCRHILIHGTPLHDIKVNIDANFMIQSVEGAYSIEVPRGQATLGEIFRKWANPS